MNKGSVTVIKVVFPKGEFLKLELSLLLEGFLTLMNFDWPNEIQHFARLTVKQWLRLFRVRVYMGPYPAL